MNALLPFCESLQLIDHFPFRRLLPIDQPSKTPGTTIDSQLQRPQHFEFGEFIDQRRVLRFSGRGRITRRFLFFAFLHLFLQRLDQFFQRFDDVPLDSLRQLADLVFAQPTGDDQHVVAELIDRLGEGDRRAFFLQQRERLSRFEGDIVFLDGQFACATTVTRLVRESLKKCRIIVVESNHEEEMLIEGPYPWRLKQRIRGRTGHLSNADCAALLDDVFHDDLKCVVLAHLSEVNNSPQVAFESVTGRMKKTLHPDIKISLARQDGAGEMLEV